MPELRTDWLTERTVIVAEGRAGRPNEFDQAAAEHNRLIGAGGPASTSPPADRESPPAVSNQAFECPFCPGQEHRTPPSVYQSVDAAGRWRTRVVPNMYPAVTLTADGCQTAGAVSNQSDPALGAHEVIVETARHVDRTAALDVSELREVLAAYGERLRHWRDDGRFRYGLVFKNQGPRAGASLAHLHSQVVALPAVPSNVGRELRRAEHEFANQKSCPYCRLIEQERAAEERIVLDRYGYVAFCPYASWQPWEVWLLPAQHQAAFEDATSPAALDRLAGALHELIGRVEAVVPDASYNLLLRTAPWTAGVEAWFHWRIELLPRAAAFAGLELAAAIHINPLAPEHAARQLRQ